MFDSHLAKKEKSEFHVSSSINFLRKTPITKTKDRFDDYRTRTSYAERSGCLIEVAKAEIIKTIHDIARTSYAERYGCLIEVAKVETIKTIHDIVFTDWILKVRKP